jgi:hypothetical protein
MIVVRSAVENREALTHSARARTLVFAANARHALAYHALAYHALGYNKVDLIPTGLPFSEHPRLAMRRELIAVERDTLGQRVRHAVGMGWRGIGLWNRAATIVQVSKQSSSQ